LKRELEATWLENACGDSGAFGSWIALSIGGLDSKKSNWQKRKIDVAMAMQQAVDNINRSGKRFVSPCLNFRSSKGLAKINE
jgi:hypothetical protein